MDTVKYSLKRLLLIAFCFFTIFSYTKVKADSNVTLTFTENSIEETVSGSGYVIDGTTVEIISLWVIVPKDILKLKKN